MDERRGVCTAILSLYVIATAHAQTQGAPVASRPVRLPPIAIEAPAEQQARQMMQWTHDYQEWRAWYLQWRNRPEPGLFSSRARRTPPVPPAWLSAFCANLAEEGGLGADACTALRDWEANDLAASLMTQRIAQVRASTEAPHNTRWWERVHVDAFWPMTRAGSGTLGVAGLHTTLHVTRRFQVFLAPGVILMRMPEIDGSPTWTTAADWGFSFGLFDVRVPVAGRPATVHLNVARVWVLGGNPMVQTGEMYLAGFSLSFKQR